MPGEEEKIVASKPLTAMKKLKSKKRRVVVTGMGVVSPLGHDVEEFYGNVLQGISGVTQIEAFDCSDFPTVNNLSLFLLFTFYFLLTLAVNFKGLLSLMFLTFLQQRIAGEIKNFTADGSISPKIAKRADKYMLYLLAAGKKALADGKITHEVMQELDRAKCGVVIGSALGGMKVKSHHGSKSSEFFKTNA